MDIDVLDPAFANPTGTPEPGGLEPRELRADVAALTAAGVAGAALTGIAAATDRG